MIPQIDISFITITYNGFADTCELIESILNHIHSVKYEVIVVDNASKIDEAQLIKQKYPSVKTIRSEINLGFSGGNNEGIKIATGKYIFFINNDTYFLKDEVINLINQLDSDQSIAGVSPKICYDIF